MKISCPSCSAKYSIADEKVQNRLAKIRCRKCGTSIVIDGNVTPAAVYAGEVEGEAPRAGGGVGFTQPTAAASAGSVYTVDFGENDQRQMTVADLVLAYNSGQVTGETYLWADGFADWTPLAQVDEVVAALNAAATGVDETSAAGASTAPSESPWADAAANRAHGTPAAAPVAARGADLFGGIDRAGAEAEIATSASSGSSAIGSAGPAFGASAPSGTGARNESSVLFSLSALTAAAGTSRPNNLAPVVPTQHVTEDSGLIDLKALTAAAEHRPAPAAPVAAAPLGFGGGLPLGGAPLGSPYGGGYGGLGSPSLPPQRAKSNMALYIGIFAVVAVLGSVLIFRLTEKEAAPPPPPIPTTPIAAPAPLPPPMPTAAALPTADAKAPSTGDAEGETSPTKSTSTTKKTTKSTSGSSSSGTSTSSSSSSSSSGSSTAPAPKKKSGGGCGCAANDLMCNMRCSSK